MFQRLPWFLFCLLAFTSTLATAEPQKGFFEGPYLALEAGVIQADFDTDRQNGQQVGRDFEPALGLLFGWNITDTWSTELEGQYSTNFNAGRREHIVGATINGRYTLITNTLAEGRNFSILPFVKAGVAFRVAVLPGNATSTDQVVTSLGLGPAVGAGVMALWKKFFFFGIDLQENLLFYDDVHQNLDLASPAAPDQLVYRGGFQPSFGALAVVGVHY